MKISESKFQVRDMNQDKVVISQCINQATTTLVGGIWTDEKGKINFVGLIHTKNGDLVPNFPSMENTYISDVAQVGLKR